MDQGRSRPLYPMDAALWEALEGDEDDEIEAVIRLRDPAVSPPEARIITQFDNIATCRIHRRDVLSVHASDDVLSLKAAELLSAALDIPGVEESLLERAENQRPEDVPETGRGTVVGFLDWGFDFAHPDFRHPDGSTRLLALWDQHLESGDRPNKYGYGIIYGPDEIDAALEARDPYAALGYHPADGDPGATGSHGAHVAGIAVGNGRGSGVSGVAPEADIVFVDIDTRYQTRDRANLGDSVTVLEAIDFIFGVAGDRPCVINGSLGSTGGSHDATALAVQGFDAALTAKPNRAICLSAGNYRAGRMHASATLWPGERQRFGWETSEADQTPNELEAWYSSHDTLDVTLISPDETYRERVTLNESAAVVIEGRTVGRIYHRAYEPNTGDHHINIFLQPGAPAGVWEVALDGQDIVDGRVHLWLERDSTLRNSQSRFHPDDADPLSTTGTICNGYRTIAVGAFDPSSRGRELATFSSVGPTREGRNKPDLVAPGVGILSTRSAHRDPFHTTARLVRKSGTSMATPHVTGTAALMFEAAKRPMPIQELRRHLLRSADPAAARDAESERGFGRGYLNTRRAVEAVRQFDAASETTISGTAMRQPELVAAPAGASVATAGQEKIMEPTRSRHIYEDAPEADLYGESTDVSGDATSWQSAPEIPSIAEPAVPWAEFEEQIAELDFERGPGNGATAVATPSVYAPALERAEQRRAFNTSPSHWFLTRAEIDRARGGHPRRLAVSTSQNRVVPLIDGEEMMRALHDDVNRTRRGDFIHFTAWRMDRTLEMIARRPASRVQQVWTNAIRRGVTSRTLLWRPPPVGGGSGGSGGLNANLVQNRESAAFLNRAGGTAVLDARTPFAGSHHQKSAIVQVEGEAIAYCGGIDLAADRWDSRRHDSPAGRRKESWDGWHDVHSRIRGPAALDIERNFRDRWNDRTMPTLIPRPTLAPRRITSSLPRIARSPGTHHVQVLRTYACVSGQYPSFAPRGEGTCLAGYLKAISRAREYIYIEEQYLVSEELSRALARALSRIRKLVILVPPRTDGFPKSAFNFHQRQFIDRLRRTAPGKVHVFHPVQPASGNPIYVHSKLMIVDDVYAVIGTSNVNRRSMTYDTEISIAVVDAEVVGGVCRFARDLRRNLWGEHLGMSPSDPRIADPVAAVAEWERQARAGAHRVRRHVTPASSPSRASQGTFNRISDPDGRCSGTPPPTPSSSSRSILAALREGRWAEAVRLAIRGGERNENQLSNMIFYARHPDLPPGYQIKSHEREYAREWLQIRDTVVRPALRQSVA